jgi:flagellar biogenesis protein FliO
MRTFICDVFSIFFEFGSALTILGLSVWAICWVLKKEQQQRTVLNARIPGLDLLGCLIFGAAFSLVSRRPPRWYTFK